MKWYLVVFLLMLSGQSELLSQQIITSPSQFVEYHRGSLPIVITVPHGGSIAPDSIPNRNCNEPVFKMEINTIEAALAISSSLQELTGCYPHLIINYLHRKKVGCNRKKILGTCFQPIAEQVWDEYHQFIDSALIYAGEENENNKFLIDLTGHDHSFQQIELGYLIPGIDLQASNGIIDLDDPINQTSIENLIDDNVWNSSRSELLRGSRALGTLITDNSFVAVPSDEVPFPFNSHEYSSSTFTTANYSDPELDNDVIAIQAALNLVGLRDNIENIQDFGAVFANSILRFITLHRRPQLTNCGTGSENPTTEGEPDELLLFPNPSITGTAELNIIGNNVEGKLYKIHNSIGQLVGAGIIKDNKVFFSNQLEAGIYFITTWQNNGDLQQQFKLVLVDR